MNFAEVASELRGLYNDQSHYPECRVPGLREADFQRWCKTLDVPRSELFDQIALDLARGFYASDLTFGFCDAVINDLFGLITSSNEPSPDLFWRVYLAFDEGEYYHDNNRDEDPVEVYTRPMITRIINDIPSAG
jgi:hypothetical protein